jgi:1-deoxy-D-xylulose-5-phosphate reductoisomerase
VVLSAIVGAAGLPATLAALDRGIDVALANKEALVAAGSLVVATAERSGAAILPVDSEHAALWMCLSAAPEGFRFPPFTAGEHVARITLTASGGALRAWPAARLASATPDDALNHPNWSMGAKVTLDTATLMNKAFELVEAHWLFGIPAERLCAVVHPQSIVHAIADLADGSSIAQLGLPDMRTPIQYALTAPSRPAGLNAHVSFAELSELTFEAPDLERFPSLGFGHRIVREGGTAGAVVNGANEAAVHAFIDRRVPLPAIHALVEEALTEVGVSPINSLDDVLSADRAARDFVERAASAYPSPVD